MSHPINLTDDQRAFLRHLLAEHREYYGILTSNPHCSPENRERFRFINKLWQKLASEPIQPIKLVRNKL
jgi:hypothetical protein